MAMTQNLIASTTRYDWQGEERCFRMPAGHHGEDYVDPRTLSPEVFYKRDRDGIMECEKSFNQTQMDGDTHHGIRWKRQEQTLIPVSQPTIANRSARASAGSFDHLFVPVPAINARSTPPHDFTLFAPIYGVDGVPVFEQQLYPSQSVLSSNGYAKPPANLPTPPDTGPRQGQGTSQTHLGHTLGGNGSVQDVSMFTPYFDDSNYVNFNALQMEGPAEYNFGGAVQPLYYLGNCSSQLRQYVVGYNPLLDNNSSISAVNMHTVPNPLAAPPQATDICKLHKINEGDSVTVSDSASQMYPKPARQVERRYSEELRVMGITPEAPVNKHHFQGCFHEGSCNGGHVDQGVGDQALPQPFGFSGRTQSTLPTNTSTQVDSNGHYKPVKVDQYLQQFPEVPKLRYPYKEVHAILVHWQEDYAYVDAKVMELHCVLWAQYQFQVQRVAIPHTSSHSFVRNRIQELINDQSHYDTMLTIYYVGGATRTLETGLTWFPLT